MKLTENFTLEELIKDSVAVRNGIFNVPDSWAKDGLQYLAINILQKVRDYYKKPVIVSSGYRSTKLNTLIGGSSTSQHMKGQAADFEVDGIDNMELAKWISKNLSYDQIILEFYDAKDGKNSGWVHCSYVSEERNRKICLRAKRVDGKTVYKDGLDG